MTDASSPPMTNVLGHARAAGVLRRAHASDRVHHAWLFEGPEGVGKRRVAFAFAALMNCTGDAPTDADGRRTDACGACRSCRGLERARLGLDGPTPPDLHLLEPDGRQIKIDAVREVTRRVPYPPIEARFRVILVSPADALGDAAANALLKTLEEPSSRTRFVLLTSRPDAVLVTIRSRCQRLRFGRLDEADVRLALTQPARFGLGGADGLEPLDAGRARTLAGLSDGSLGRALQLVDDPVLAAKDAVLSAAFGEGSRAVDLMGGFAFAQAAADAKGEYGGRAGLGTILDLLAQALRDALVLRETGAEDVVSLALGPPTEAIRGLASRLGRDALLERLDRVLEARVAIERRNLNPRLVMERLVWILRAPAGREATAAPPLR